MFTLIWILIVGFVIGSLAQFFLPGDRTVPMWLTVLLGVAGALVGNILASILGVRHTAGIDWIRHALQIGAAAVFIAAVGARRPGRQIGG